MCTNLEHGKLSAETTLQLATQGEAPDHRCTIIGRFPVTRRLHAPDSTPSGDPNLNSADHLARFLGRLINPRFFGYYSAPEDLEG